MGSQFSFIYTITCKRTKRNKKLTRRYLGFWLMPLSNMLRQQISRSASGTFLQSLKGSADFVLKRAEYIHLIYLPPRTPLKGILKKKKNLNPQGQGEQKKNESSHKEE